MNSRHPETPARGKAGSEPQLLTPFPVDPLDPLDPVDPLENSKNVIFAERVVIFGPVSLENNKNKVSTLILPELLRSRNKK